MPDRARDAPVSAHRRAGSCTKPGDPCPVSRQVEGTSGGPPVAAWETEAGGQETEPGWVGFRRKASPEGSPS